MLSLLSFPAYVVHVWLPNSNVLVTRQCRLPSLSSPTVWGLSTLEPWDERELKLPFQSSCRSKRPRRGCQWWWSRGRRTDRQHRVRGRQWSWAAVVLLPVPGRSPSSEWWSVRSSHSETQSINYWISSWVWVANAASSANSIPLTRTLRTFVLVLSLARLKEHAMWSGTNVDSFYFYFEGRFLQQSKDNPKERCSKEATLFDAAANFEWLRWAAVELHCSFRVSVERLDRSCTAVWVGNRSLGEL